MSEAACVAAVAAALDRYLAPPSSAGDEAIDRLRRELGRLRAGLDEPLRVAITGRVNAGKSTIVNALLQRRIAATDVTECTRYVTWYRFGVPERVEVVLVSGERRQLRLREDGRLPDRLGIEIEHPDGDAASVVDRLDVFLSNSSLERMTLIDTPGIASLNDEASSATRQVVASDRASRGAAAQADAMVFVLAGDLQRDDASLLSAFHRLFGSLGASTFSTVAVLNKVDQSCDDDIDPVATIAPRCARLADQLRSTVAAVIPLVGLLAETAESGRLTHADIEALRAAALLDRAVVDRALLSTDRFLRSTTIVAEPETRDRLLELLDLSGLRIVIELFRSTGQGLEHAVEAVRLRSGLRSLWTLLDGSFFDHADVLKAAASMAGIERLAYSAPSSERQRLLDALDEVRIVPVMHRVAELRAAQRVGAGDVVLSADETVELGSLFGAGSPARRLGLTAEATTDAVLAAIRGRIHHWKQRANRSTVGAGERDVADVVIRSYELLWAQMIGG